MLLPSILFITMSTAIYYLIPWLIPVFDLEEELTENVVDSRPAESVGLELKFPFFAEDEIDDNEKYLLYLPYEGFTNQLYSLLRAMFLAKQLNRTLLVPPIYSSVHDTLKGATLDLRLVLNFTSFQSNANICCNLKFLDKKMIPWLKRYLVDPDAGCFSYGKWSQFYNLGVPAVSFLSDYDLHDTARLDWHRLPTKNDRNSTYLVGTLKARAEANLVCVANLQHLQFGKQIEEYWKWLKFSDNVVKTAMDILDYHGVQPDEYAAVHWRRGDFAWACQNKVWKHCWPELDTLKEVILRISESHGLSVFLIGTNDKDFHLDMSEYGIDVILISMPVAVEDVPIEWTNLAAVAVDTYLFANAAYFVGNKHSSISFTVIMRRNQMGLKTMTETF